MNTICCKNCKISINYYNGISYQSHYLSISISVPRNVHALALKWQNIPQKSQVQLQFRCQEWSIRLLLPISNQW